jgi:LemA protein
VTSLIVVAGVLLFIVVAVVIYNSVVSLSVRADAAWSDIDVQLKRRHDLIPNLVETVKGYAAHESSTFEKVARLRSSAMQATAPADRAVAEGQLTGALRGLMAVAESYPQLQASQQFTELQSSLRETEDALQNARRYYNAVVRDLNTRVQTAPTNLFAAMFGLRQRPFFDASPADREAVAVHF